MPKLSGPYGVAALFVLISAALHIFAFLVGGFTRDALILIPFGFLYIAIAAGLTRGYRWLAWITFFLTFAGGIVSISKLWSLGPIPPWWWALILAANGIAAIALFVNLWRPPPSTDPT